MLMVIVIIISLDQKIDLVEISEIIQDHRVLRESLLDLWKRREDQEVFISNQSTGLKKNNTDPGGKGKQGNIKVANHMEIEEVLNEKVMSKNT